MLIFVLWSGAQERRLVLDLAYCSLRTHRAVIFYKISGSLRYWGASCSMLFIQWVYWGRTAVAWSALLTHLAAAAIAITGIALWSSFGQNPSGSGQSEAGNLSRALSWNLFERLLPNPNFGELVSFVKVVKQTLILTIVPLGSIVIAYAIGAINWKRDSLFQLFACASVVIIMFNLILYRFPGAGSYYMVQAVVPLGYLLGRSFESLMKVSRRQRSGIGAVLFLLTLHGIMNLPPITQAMLPDLNRIAAQQFEAVLPPERCCSRRSGPKPGYTLSAQSI